eukprot:2073373-Prymnesium_polylepis.1
MGRGAWACCGVQGRDTGRGARRWRAAEAEACCGPKRARAGAADGGRAHPKKERKESMVKSLSQLAGKESTMQPITTHSSETEGSSSA